ncbi:UNVERIFIED_CONTAM: hypothetical protein Slati_0889100 [Sesamum latifolium]|uniref:DUF4283 domain-containing protein n=1 Tax=Sesamum latifolium TaxID=2727402 RepID=A0AAW2XNL7_9LAMI
MFSDFHSLATRVLDGDEASLEKLESLKQQWERRFPVSSEHGLRTVRRLLPRFPSKVTFMPRRSIQLPSKEGTGPSLQESLGQEPSRKSRSIHPRNREFRFRRLNNLWRQAPLPQNCLLVMLRSICPGLTQSQMVFSIRQGKRYGSLRENQNDEIIIKPTIAMLERGSECWQSTAVGYLLGKKPFLPQLEAFARANWKGLQHISATANGFYFFTFKTPAFMEEVMEEGLWLFQGQPVVLQAWEQGMSLRRYKHMQVPVWIRHRHLPMEYWTEDGLSVVASGVGVLLYTDKITKFCSQLDYARVCIMLDYHSKLPRHLVVLSPILREGNAVPIKVDVEYEWLPMRCTQCCSLGHNRKNCPEVQVRKETVPMSVFVQKQQSNLVDISSQGGERADLEADLAAESLYYKA